LFTDEELADLILLLAMTPEIGVVMPGTGGIRKLRSPLARKGKGKRGGARVVFFYYNDETPVALLAVYSKGEKIDLSPNEKKELRELVNQYIEEYSKEKVAGPVRRGR
jgi:hypothetical protein